MITGIDLNETKEFTSPRDKVNPTVWIVGALGSDKTGKITLAGKPSFDQVITTAQEGLRGWSNFKDNKGADIAFARNDEGVVPLEVIKQIPPIVLIEISAEILKISRLAEIEIKN